MPTHTVLLYYQYAPLDDPHQVMTWQKALCRRLNIKGRIIIADEGINGTVAGLPDQIKQYQAETESHPALANMEWKESTAEDQVFPKLSVKVRDEIVTLGLKDQGCDVNLDDRASYIEPHELEALYESDQDFVILDARNEYEARLGRFKDALVPPIETFREFPQFVADHLLPYRDKPVITYCTGGIRCEKASAYLRQAGFSQVKQLHGGVHRYAEETGGKYFEGKLFVFDQRLQLDINRVNPTIITDCQHCQQPVARYIDCPVDTCNALYICCQDCQEQYHGACSQDCYQQLASDQPGAEFATMALAQ